MDAFEGRVLQLDFGRESVSAGLTCRHIFAALSKLGKVDECIQSSSTGYLVALHDEAVTDNLLTLNQITCMAKGLKFNAKVSRPNAEDYADLVGLLLCSSETTSAIASEHHHLPSASNLLDYCGVAPPNADKSDEENETDNENDFKETQSQDGQFIGRSTSFTSNLFLGTEEVGRTTAQSVVSEANEANSNKYRMEKKRTLSLSLSDFSSENSDVDMKTLEEQLKPTKTSNDQLNESETYTAPKNQVRTSTKRSVRLYLTNASEVNVSSENLMMLLENFDSASTDNDDDDDEQPDAAEIVFDQGGVICVDLTASQSKIDKLLQNGLKSKNRPVLRMQVDDPRTTHKNVTASKNSPGRGAQTKELQVKISGFSGELDEGGKELLELILENRKLGGGKLAELEYTFDRRGLYIAIATFESKLMVLNLLSKSGGYLKIRKEKLKVSEYTAPPPKPPIPESKCVFLLSELTASVSDEVIATYFGSFITDDSNDDVDVVHRSADKQVAVVRFLMPKQIETLRKKLIRRPLSKANKTEIKPTFESDTIQIYCVKSSDDHSLEVLYAFLDTDKSGVRGQFDATWSDNNRCFSIKFDDYQDASRALNSISKLKNSSFIAFPYFDCVGHAVPSAAIVDSEDNKSRPKNAKVVEVEFAVALDRNWSAYFSSSVAAQAALTEVVKTKHYVACKWKQSNHEAAASLYAVCKLQAVDCDTKMQSLTKLSDWVEQNTQLINKAIDVTFVKQQSTVLAQVWTELMNKLTKTGLTSENLQDQQVQVIADNESCTVTLQGPIDSVHKVAQSLNELVEQAHEELKRKTERIKECISLKLFEHDFLEADEDFIEKLKRGKGAANGQQAVELTFSEASEDSTELQLELSGGLMDVLQAKLQVSQYFKSLTESAYSVEVNESSALLLSKSKGAQKAVKAALKSKGLTAVWHLSPAGDAQMHRLSVYASSSDEAANSCKMLQKTLTVERVQLDNAQAALVKGQEWLQFVGQLKQQYAANAIITQETDVIVIYSVKPFGSEVFGKVKNFLVDNIVANDNVVVGQIKLRYLLLFMNSEMKQIEQKSSTGTLRVQKDDKEADKLRLLGTVKERQAFTRELEGLTANINTRNVQVESKSTAMWLLRSHSAQIHLERIEKSCSCAIIVQNDSHQIEALPQVQEVKAPVTKARYTTNVNQTKISVILGDALEETSDVLVSFTDRDLKETSGGSFRRQLFKQAGKKTMESECEKLARINKVPIGEVAFTGPGRLKFQSVAHLVCLFCITHEHDQAVRSAFINLLLQMIQKNYTSFVVPLVFSDRDLKLVAECVTAWLTTDGQAVRELRFVGQCEKLVQEMSQWLKRLTDTDASPTSIPGAVKVRKLVQDLVTVQNGIQVKLVIGELLQQTADVLVNTTSADLNLNSGQVSKQFLLHAGQNLQTECSQTLANKFGRNLQPGEFVETSACNLRQCRAVFHTALPRIDIRKPQANTEVSNSITTVMQTMMNECNQKGYSSIAYPALGTGNLSWPAATVAQAMFTCVETYTNRNIVAPLQQQLKTVLFVCYDKDQRTSDAFLDELQRRFPTSFQAAGNTTSTSAVSSSADADRAPPTRRMVSESNASNSTTSVISGAYGVTGAKQAKVGECIVEVLQGDILQQFDIHSIVNSTDSQFSTGGKVMQSLIRIGGEKLKQEISSYGPITSKVATTSGGDTLYRYIFHAVAPQDDINSWSDVVKQCLKEAESKKVTSIALPALGTGMRGLRHTTAASLILDAVAQFVTKEKPAHLKRVRLCIFENYMVKEFEDELDKKVNVNNVGAWQKMTSFVASWFNSGHQSSEQQDEVEKQGELPLRNETFLTTSKVSLQLGYVDEKAPQLVINNIESIVANEQREKEVKDEALPGLVNPIREICEQNGVNGTYNQYMQKFTLQGLMVDVERSYSTIMELINATNKRKAMEKEHILLFKSTRWEYEHTPNDYTTYDLESNYTIEEAYKNALNKVQLTLKDDYDDTVTNVEISFADMIEYELKTRKQQRVKRNDLTMAKSVADIDVPKAWTPMTAQDGRVKEVTLAATDQEYIDVSKLFLSTAGQHRILEIKRIQNKELYGKYVVHQRSMETRLKQRSPNLQVEHRLFHGTSEDTLVSINKYGFNRSYCGKNAVVYGNGVYFAVQSAYSAQNTYSRPNQLGEKFMYLARVLVGESTTGRQGLVVPPPNSQTNELFDSVCDNPQAPSIVVVFSDTQAYPEYLIRFQ